MEVTWAAHGPKSDGRWWARGTTWAQGKTGGGKRRGSHDHGRRNRRKDCARAASRARGRNTVPRAHTRSLAAMASVEGHKTTDGGIGGRTAPGSFQGAEAGHHTKSAYAMLGCGGTIRSRAGEEMIGLRREAADHMERGGGRPRGGSSRKGAAVKVSISLLCTLISHLCGDL